MIELNNDNFDEVTKSGTVLVDCWTEWCPPCKASMPHVEAFAAENTGVVVAKLNVEDFDELGAKLSVRAAPTFILFKDGVEIKRHVGSVSKAMLVSLCG